MINFLTMSIVMPFEERELPFRMSRVPEVFQRKCEAELRETPERKKKSVQDLRNMLSKEKATKDICFHEDFLVQYLRHNKYKTKKAFNHLRNFIIFRRKEAKLFESFPLEFFLKPSTKFLILLPKRSPDGSTLVLGQVGEWDPDELSIEEMKSFFLIFFLQLFRDPMTQINGIKSIFDFAGTGFKHYRYFTPQIVYLLYHVAICCAPGRYKEIHVLNQTAGCRILWSILKIFLSDKIRNRIFFHSDVGEILNYFPKSVIPVQYGGELLDMHATNFPITANMEQKRNTAAGQPNFY